MKSLLITLMSLFCIILASCNLCYVNTDAVISFTATDFYTLKPIKGCSVRLFQQYPYGNEMLLSSVATGENGVTSPLKVKFRDACEYSSQVCFELMPTDTSFLLINPTCFAQLKGEINTTLSIKQRSQVIALRTEHQNPDTDSLSVSISVNMLKLLTKSIGSKSTFDSTFYFKTFPEEHLRLSYNYLTKAGAHISVDTSILPTYFSDTFRISVKY